MVSRCVVSCCQSLLTLRGVWFVRLCIGHAVVSFPTEHPPAIFLHACKKMADRCWVDKPLKKGILQEVSSGNVPMLLCNAHNQYIAVLCNAHNQCIAVLVTVAVVAVYQYQYQKSYLGWEGQ